MIWVLLILPAHRASARHGHTATPQRRSELALDEVVVDGALELGVDLEELRGHLLHDVGAADGGDAGLGVDKVVRLGDTRPVRQLRGALSELSPSCMGTHHLADPGRGPSSLPFAR